MTAKSTATRNWKHYNENLVQRGNLTLWLDPNLESRWQAPRATSHPGRPTYYSDHAIELVLTLKLLFHQGLRQAEGLTRSLLQLAGLDLIVPDYTTCCRRQKHLSHNVSHYKNTSSSEPFTIVVDSTGLKVFGEGEWKVRAHGYEKKRQWRKVHIAACPKTGLIHSSLLTTSSTQDCQAFPELIESISGSTQCIIGDGAYDRFSCYEVSLARGAKGVFPPQRNSKTLAERPSNKKKASELALLARDQMIEQCREVGRPAWKMLHQYYKRNYAETIMFRLKQILGQKLYARTWQRQEAELALRCHILNKMILAHG